MPPLTTKSSRSQFDNSRDASACPIPPDDKKVGEIWIVNAEDDEDDFSSAAEKRLLRRLDLRFIPGFILMYTLYFFAAAIIVSIRRNIDKSRKHLTTRETSESSTLTPATRFSRPSK
ncbi:hypothetical protein ARMGADRAFT_1092326 [Armillaria gallica]|uniref:Uncharacterized protein n=1 Tax=Armillaria gallica TaxID=47427 RepID=A0A2H3CEN9_ARMGA|nr:hypothetical protein ARMGADRAFT_1092326 [Armillaria gallica]